MDSDTFATTGVIWSAIESGLRAAKKSKAVKSYSYDGDSDSGAVLVTLPDGSEFFIKIEEAR
jgi:hypothetical protein